MAVVRSVMGEKWLKEKLEKEGITISTNKISIDNEREMIIDKDIVRRPQEYYPVKSISMKNKHLIIGSGEGIHTFRINNQNKIKTDVLQ
jgi:hypothetical protein